MKQDKGTKTKKPSSAMQGSLHASRFLTYFVFIVIGAAVFTLITRPEQRFFIENSSGRSAEVFPMDEPNVTPSSLIKWATMAATSAYTVDFYNYQATIDALEDYFTIDGYKHFLESIDASGALDKVISDKLIVSAVAIGSAVILSEGEQRGVYTWRIQVPLLLTYQGASTSSTENRIAVTLLVTRVPTDVASKGIGVAQIVDGDIYAGS